MEIKSLSSEPALNYAEFKDSLTERAGELCTQHFPGEGLNYFYVTMTDDEFDELELVCEEKDGSEENVKYDRPELPKKPKIHGGSASTAEVNIYNVKNTCFMEVTAGVAQLRKEVLAACGPTIRAQLAVKAGGMMAQKLADIIAFLDERYGQPTTADINKMRDSLSTKFTSISALPDDIARFQKTIKQLRLAKAGLSENHQIQLFGEATAGLSGIAACIRRYMRKVPRVPEQEFEDLVKMVLDEMPSLTTEDHGYASAIAMAAKQSEVDVLKERLNTLEKALKNQTSSARSKKFYCFMHGTNFTHDGTSCKIMPTDSKYTEAMIQAKSCKIIDGVQGKKWCGVVNKSTVETSNNTDTFTTTESTLTPTAYLDSAATDSIIRKTDADACGIAKTSNKTINMGLPNHEFIKSEGRGTMQTGTQEIPVHIFADNHLQQSLLAAADYTNQNCVVTFTKKDATVTDEQGNTVLSAHKDQHEKLWKVKLPTATNNLAHNVIRHELHAEIVNFWHKTLGCPTNSTLLKALRKGYLKTIPQLTTNMVSRNLPQSMASAKGHLDQNRQGQRSSKSTIQQRSAISTSNEDDDIEEPKDTYIITRVESYTNHVDATGQLPARSRRGNLYMLVAVYNNYIHVVPMASRKGPEYVKAYKSMFEHFQQRGVHPKAQRLDNETSGALTNYLKNEQNVTIEYVPPDNHRTNKAERAIRDVKNHFIAIMSATPKAFPMDLWDEAIDQLNITINLLRPYAPDHNISAYEGIHNETYNFDKHPMAPFGSEVLVFESPNKRASWDTHGVAGYYIGPAVQHYRCYRTHVIKTGGTRITDTVQWLLTPYRAPGSSSNEIMLAAIQDVKTAFQTIIDYQLLPQGSLQQADTAKQSLTSALHEVTQLFHKPPDDQKVQTTADQTAEVQRVETAEVQRVETAEGQRVKQDDANTAKFLNSVDDETQDKTMRTNLPGIGTIITPNEAQNFNDTTVVKTEAAKPRPAVAKRVSPKVENTRVLRSHAKANNINEISTDELDDILQEHMRECREANGNVAPTISLTCMALQAQASADQFATDAAEYCMQECEAPQENVVNAALNLDENGNKLTYTSAMRGPDKENWMNADGEEISRLLDSGTITPIFPNDQPYDRRQDTTYYNPQTKEKLDENNKKTYRIRGTAGGDKINYPGQVSAKTADMEVVKMLIQSVASDKVNKGESHWMTLDIKDYYLGAPLERSEFVRISTRFIPETTMKKYEMHKYENNKAVLFEIKKCMYGLPQAGYLSQQRLIAHLKKYGYYQTRNVPCLFKHKTNSCVFTLVVDDFGLKYAVKRDAEHLIDTLQKLYKLHIDWEGKKYLGFEIHFDDEAQEVVLGMPKYVPKMLELFYPGENLKGAKSPAVYTPPQYGAQQKTPMKDVSEPLSGEDKTKLQAMVGSLLFYARAIDYTMVPATTHLASRQANPTQDVMDSAHRLFQYAAAYPNNKLVFKACDMVLYIQSDASYLSRPGSRSVSGGIFYCGYHDDTHRINGAILVNSAVLSVVAAAVSEAEYGACFHNGQTGVWLRTILETMGYRQPITTIQCDNACAVGLANDTLKEKKSKSIDMNFHWIRDRVKQRQFNVFWREGALNLADFFTKPLPVHEHQRIMHKLIRVENDPDNLARTKRMQRSSAYWTQRFLH